jgi:hypothetical protein
VNKENITANINSSKNNNCKPPLHPTANVVKSGKENESESESDEGEENENEEIELDTCDIDQDKFEEIKDVFHQAIMTI